jgi:hypothetical protein
MENIFEEKRFLARKWLLSFAVGEERLLPASRMAYKGVKSACSQIHRLGIGRWTVSKKGLNDLTRVRRVM